MGSGSFVYAAMGKVKRIYATELDNYTFNAVNALMSKVDMLKLGVLFDTVKDDVYKEIMALYETSCCGCRNYISRRMGTKAFTLFERISQRYIFESDYKWKVE